jgi:hypothetical protein
MARMMRWADHAAFMEEIKNIYKILVRKPEGKRPLVKTRLRWEVNVTMDINKGLEGAD